MDTVITVWVVVAVTYPGSTIKLLFLYQVIALPNFKDMWHEKSTFRGRLIAHILVIVTLPCSCIFHTIDISHLSHENDDHVIFYRSFGTKKPDETKNSCSDATRVVVYRYGLH